MEDLILYLCSALRDQELGLTADEIETGCTIIATAVPLMLMTCVLVNRHLKKSCSCKSDHNK